MSACWGEQVHEEVGETAAAGLNLLTLLFIALLPDHNSLIVSDVSHPDGRLTQYSSMAWTC